MKKFLTYLHEDWSNTARFHTELNPILWENDHLHPDIRRKLLEFARTWADFANIPSNLVEDILLVGGSAGYNYTDKSDIDVHIVLDRAKLGNRSLVDELLQTKKSLWGLQHHIRVAGLTVEGYAQDKLEEAPKSQGIYSILNDVWLRKPELPPTLDFLNTPSFHSKVQSFMDRIDHLIDSNASSDNFKKLKDKIKEMRTSGLQKGGEYSHENYTFKTLRDLGYLDKMTDYVRNRQDKSLSL